MIRVAPTHAWIPFTLYSELEVDSVRWDDGTAVEFWRAEDQVDLWVDLSKAPEPESRLTFHYSGELMERPGELWIRVHSHTRWYPVYHFGRPIEYKLTFHTPEKYVVTTVGTKVHEENQDGVTTTVWETGLVRSLTFNIGEFEDYVSEEEGQATLQVLINERAHREAGRRAMSAGALMYKQNNMTEVVASDIRSSFRVFEELYGEAPLQRFVATEIPYGHSTAYPGLIMFSWKTFQYTNSEGLDEMHRAHEVAHQWWGVAVRPATYRDWWLAEGFAEFSALWYAARVKGFDLYFRRLEQTRKDILDRRDESAPLSLGQRAATTRDPEDYQLMVYYKGAWVLHMLRTLLTDPDTGNDEVFQRAMQTFYSSHVGGAATTRQFQQAVERVTGSSLGWFFDEWVRGSSIPTYTFSYKYSTLPDGQVKATVRVRQEDVPEDFRMIVPIFLDFGEEGTATVRLNVVGPVTEVDLPLLPREPDRMEFNPFEAVLAETKTERWRN